MLLQNFIYQTIREHMKVGGWVELDSQELSSPATQESYLISSHYTLQERHVFYRKICLIDY